MPLADADIEAQVNSNTCCDVAIINLFKLRGLVPPSYDTIDELFSALEGVLPNNSTFPQYLPATPDDRGTNILSTFYVLTTLGRFVSSVVGIPVAYFRQPDLVIKYFLDKGCHLIIFFSWRAPDNGEIVSHVSVCEGMDERGYLLIDGEPRCEGFPKEFELEPTIMPTTEMVERAQAAIDSSQVCGTRRVLPFCEVCSPVLAPMGITPDVGLLGQFIVAFPGNINNAYRQLAV